MKPQKNEFSYSAFFTFASRINAKNRMAQAIKINKGLDIRLVGEAERIVMPATHSDTVMVYPEDILDIRPKVTVTVGTEVKAGTPLMFDKNNDAYQIVSPVSGEVVEVMRGEKRVLLGIKILADKETRYEEWGPMDLSKSSSEELIKAMCASGVWAHIRMRPFDAVAFPQLKPFAVFVSAFDSAPLAPDMDELVKGEEEAFSAGLRALAHASSAPVHLSVHASKNTSPAFLQCKEAAVHVFDGPHPAGNVSVQMQHIRPLNKGEVAWTLSVSDVIIIGRFVLTGRYDARRTIAVTGAQIKSPRYVKTILGASMASIIGDNLQANPSESRFISGNVLTGRNVGEKGHLTLRAHQVTVIPEGGEPAFFGWMAPGFDKFSMSKTFFTWLMAGKKFNLNTNNNGEERAFVVTGEYEKVFPFQIMPVPLLKAILTEDIEMQENLGIYEVVPEDFALCEFVCTSKIESQDILARGIKQLYGELVDSLKPAEHHH
jgi:Na+-transporting NADH:ubiquinone oxidoreductase subunit A